MNRLFLCGLVVVGVGCSPTPQAPSDLAQGPQSRIGILVEVSIPPELATRDSIFRSDPARATQGSNNAVARVFTVPIHETIGPELVRELPEFAHIKWAVERPRPPLKPDCHLLFEISRFSYNYTSSNPDDEPTFQMSLDARVVMEEIASRRVLFSEKMEFSYRKAVFGPEELRNARAQFQRRVARGLWEKVDELLTSQ
jgi:hypothetical protein